jgi:hypothetical protein
VLFLAALPFKKLMPALPGSFEGIRTRVPVDQFSLSIFPKPD